MASDSVTIVLPPDPSPDLLDRLRENFPDATVAPPDAPDAAAAILDAEDALADAVAASASLPEALAAWWAGFPNGGAAALALAAAIFLAAWAMERLARARLGAGRAPATAETPAFTGRCARAFGFLLRRIAGLAVFSAAALVLARLASPLDPAAPELARTLLAPVLWFRIVRLAIETLAAPDAPERRPMGFTENEAAVVWRAGRMLTWLSLAIALLRALLTEAVGLAPEGQAARVALILIQAAVTAIFFLWIGRPVGALAARALAGAARPAGRLDVLAARWSWLYAGLAVADGALKAMGALGVLSRGATSGTGPSLLILCLAPLAIIGLGAWRAEIPATGRGKLLPAAFALAEGLIAIGAAMLLLTIWGINPYRQEGATGFARLLPALIEAGLVAVVGVAIWRAVSTALATPPRPGPGEPIDEEVVRSASRLDTILPLLRGFALAVIGVVGGMTALAAIGVDIAPLLASAGVIGLAIGFGAQRLVSDVISGLFFLYEDAFRIGEYIETRSGKGVVERISIRSVRLRHHRGPVFTIPFSEMGTIQNHSRDWVKVKFTFAVPSDEDVEVIRKLVKKVGETLQADPELAGKFLEPLKSQGAVAIVDSSYQIACKFTCKPGQQFLIRRKAIAAVQKALAEKGIDLFRPQVMLSGDGHAGKPAAG
jgi:small-conductance mechanosensitive channel